MQQPYPIWPLPVQDLNYRTEPPFEINLANLKGRYILGSKHRNSLMPCPEKEFRMLDPCTDPQTKLGRKLAKYWFPDMNGCGASSRVMGSMSSNAHAREWDEVMISGLATEGGEPGEVNRPCSIRRTQIYRAEGNGLSPTRRFRDTDSRRYLEIHPASGRHVLVVD